MTATRSRVPGSPAEPIKLACASSYFNGEHGCRELKRVRLLFRKGQTPFCPAKRSLTLLAKESDPF